MATSRQIQKTKTQNGELKTKMAYSESLNVALAKKNEEFFLRNQTYSQQG